MNGYQPAHVTEKLHFERYRSIIDDYDAFVAANLRPLPRFAWVNSLRTSAHKLAGWLGENGYDVRQLPWTRMGLRIEGSSQGLGRHWSYLGGFFHIQEASAMIAARLLEARSGERILDLCAAPGNKTAQLAIAMENRGTVVANDLLTGRLKPLRAIIDRLGLLNVTVTNLDGVSLPKATGLFDRVLVDAPCSCEGTSRKNPAILRRAASNHRTMSRIQKLLLLQAVRRCKPGGRIVYSTCTYAPEENEAVVDAVLRQMPGRLRIEPFRIADFRTEPGIIHWQGQKYHSALRHTLRIWPHSNDTAGGYIAVLEKNGGNASGRNSDKMPCSHPGTGCAKKLSKTEADSILAPVLARFGMPSAAFDRVELYRKNSRQVFAVSAGHHPISVSDRITGLPLLHLGRGVHKLSTAAATAFGHAATRNLVSLNTEQASQYLSRRTVRIDGAQAGDCDGGGYVLMRYREAILGVGLYREETRAVESCFPKSLAVSKTRNGG